MATVGAFTRSVWGRRLPVSGGSVESAVPSTFNPANINADLALSNGNLTATRSGSASATAGGKGTLPKTTGSWHVEFTITSIVGAVNVTIGAALEAFSNTATLTAAGSGGVRSDGSTNVNGVAQAASDTFTTGDIIAVEYDATAGNLWLQKLGGTGRKGPFTLPAGAGIVPAATVGGGATGVGSVININAGQSAFAITPTGGFSAWA